MRSKTANSNKINDQYYLPFTGIEDSGLYLYYYLHETFSTLTLARYRALQRVGLTNETSALMLIKNRLRANLHHVSMSGMSGMPWNKLSEIGVRDCRALAAAFPLCT